MRNESISISTLVALVVMVLPIAAREVAAEETVTVYVSLDQEHSERVLADFEKETGIRIDAVYDTCKTFSIGYH